ncbi:hypothetical protein [Polyangium sp. 15x6]|uniref:hypothetical protein n=1 Tax=Polyangium sp. 15x6 TaxID=3042687 RepID=UPI00249BB94B|nr:hypothetical protein [Polyangium sp. 15x6]
MLLAVLTAAQAIGCGYAGDGETAAEMNGERGVRTTEQAVSIPQGFAWDWGNVNGVLLSEVDNVATVPGGTTVRGTAHYFIDAGLAGCPGCISQIIMGVTTESKECVYSGVGIRDGSASFSLVAPRDPGIYPVWASPQWQYTCADALRLANDGSAVGLIAVYADPHDWGWGSLSSVRVNGQASKRVRVAPGARVSLDASYFIDASRGGCPGCISQIVVGIEGGAKQCIYSGMGVVNQRAAFTLEAPRQRGIYQVWASPQWQYTCEDALNLANGGAAVAFIEVIG